MLVIMDVLRALSSPKGLWDSNDKFSLGNTEVLVLKNLESSFSMTPKEYLITTRSLSLRLKIKC